MLTDDPSDYKSAMNVVNVALDKPACQSSLSYWSRPGESKAAVNGRKTGGCSFHTDFESNPWWQVDLEDVHALSEIVIFNRAGADSELAGRARSLMVMVSVDGLAWRTIHSGGQAFGGISDQRPLRVDCGGGEARFVRLQLQEPNYLHLDEVEIFAEHLLSPLTVFQSPSPKTRLGRGYDGGYVICGGLEPYDLLISGGISSDISFEMDFLSRHNVDCHAFDHTIAALPQEHPRLRWINKAIGGFNAEHESNLKELLQDHADVFLKMDIEGGEYPWLDCLTRNDLLRLKQIVIEMHVPYSREKLALLRKLLDTHAMVHLHANNCCGTRMVGGIATPNIFEATLIRRGEITGPLELNRDPIPSVLDMPNVPSIPDIPLRGWPFTAPA